ncbi:unnamed protein product [Paramecium sonneborni]|uniref:Transmembrane protein n=1 Tax=Paramecium sonneborni TaxID=65129 RepID=A0A8S1MUL1_9CILI|nr:unnamed protein product [Paramecium sonneborni]
MMYKLLSCIRCLTLKRATSLLQLLIVCIVITLCLIVLTVNRVMMDALISEISDKLLFKQNFQSYELQTEMLKYQMNWPLTKRFQMMKAFGQIYQNFQTSIIQNQSPLECPIYIEDLKQEFNILFGLPEFCVSNQNMQMEKEKHQFNLFINFLNQLLIPLTWSPITDLYMSSTDSSQFFASCPPFFNFPSYYPHDRPWYINHIEQTQKQSGQFFVSNIYESFGTNELSFTITYSLQQKDLCSQEKQKIDGIMGYDLNFKEFEDQLNIKSFIYFLLNPLGQIIHTNYFQSSNIKLDQFLVYIYQQNVTGFNKVDWDQIRNQAKNYSYFNNCSFQIQHLCRYNSIYNEDIILHVLNLNQDFYLVIFQNVTIQQQNIMEAQQRKKNIIDSFRAYLVCLVIASTILLILSWIGLYFFFRPLKQIRLAFLNQLRYKFSSSNKLMGIYNSFDENKIWYLNQAMKNLKTKMNDIKSKKCENCHLIENFKYPKNSLPIEYMQIKNKVKFVNINENREIQESQEWNNIKHSSEIPIFQELRQSLFSYIHIQSSQTLQSEMDENLQLINEPNAQRFI